MTPITATSVGIETASSNCPNGIVFILPSRSWLMCSTAYSAPQCQTCASGSLSSVGAIEDELGNLEKGGQDCQDHKEHGYIFDGLRVLRDALKVQIAYGVRY